MSAIKCTSCGASNQLPEGKISMFCAFCGTSIQSEKGVNVVNSQSPLLSKPRVIYANLDLENRNINSLLDIIPWFSNNELKQIEIVKLNNNNISNFEGLESFNPKQLYLSKNKIHCTSGLSNVCIEKSIDLSNNEIIIFESFPKRYSINSSLFVNLSNNKKFCSFSGTFEHDIVNYIKLGKKCSISFNINGCEKFDVLSLKSTIEKVKQLNSEYNISFNVNKDFSNSDEFINLGFVKNQNPYNSDAYVFEFNKNQTEKKVYNFKSNEELYIKKSEKKDPIDVVFSVLFWPFYGWYMRNKKKY